MPNNEHGDFQTPLALARQCLALLDLPDDARVLEPTCGTGAFLQAATDLAPASERIGLELQPQHAAAASAWGDVRVADIFRTDLRHLSWRTAGPLYVVGNPPWVTAADLRRMDSTNVPPKSNVKGARGIDAMLGSSNFDVAEFVLLKVLEELDGEPLTLAMLCKTQVARAVIEQAARLRLPVAGARLFRIDAKRWFDAGVDAGWFVLNLEPAREPRYAVDLFDDVFAPGRPPGRRFGVVDGRLVADVDRYETVREADGVCPFEWRSGLKHDASSVFELTASPGPTTKDGEPLDLESDYVLPLVKSTDLFRGRHRELRRWVVVPQLTFGADTAALEHDAPKLWAYLTAHSDVLDARRSSIYRNRPRFSVFGHGHYTYAPYKVAISGLHKQPIFRLVEPIEGRPVVLDDTCYFLPFDDADRAAEVTDALNGGACRDLIESLVFWDAKRPITKRLLARIDLDRLAAVRP